MQLNLCRPIALLILLGLITVLAACGGEDVDALRDLDEGKLAPPGVTLVKQYGDDGPYPNDASYQRVYQAPAATGDGTFLVFFREELEEKRSWHRGVAAGEWLKGEFVITTGGGGIHAESGNRQWTVRVTYNRVDEGTR